MMRTLLVLALALVHGGMLLASCGGEVPCGNGKLDDGEACDDGNDVSGDGCNDTCSSDETCGNEIVDMGETCDPGEETVECDYDCTVPLCGDGAINWRAGEECDDRNTNAGDGCQDCKLECGNGKNDPTEPCDSKDIDGDGLLDQTADCNADCTLPLCGDGDHNRPAGEVCEDGNTRSGDGCTEDCKAELSLAGTVYDYGLASAAIWFYNGSGVGGFDRTSLRPAMTHLGDHQMDAPFHGFAAGGRDYDGDDVVDEGVVLEYSGGAWQELVIGSPLSDGLAFVSRIAHLGPASLLTLVQYQDGTRDVLYYDGTSWDSLGFARDIAMTDVWASSLNNVYVTGLGGTLFHHDGAAWQEITLTATPPYYDPNLRLDFLAIDGSGPDDVFVVGGGETRLGEQVATASIFAHYDGVDWTVEFNLQAQVSCDFNCPYGIHAWSTVSAQGDGNAIAGDARHLGVLTGGTWRFYSFGSDSNQFQDIVTPPGEPLGTLCALGSDRMVSYHGVDGWQGSYPGSVHPGEVFVLESMEYVSGAP